jgi:hypothetical protein
MALISLDYERWDHKPSTTLQYKNEVDKYGNPKTEARVLGARLGVDTKEVGPSGLAKAIVQGQTWSPYVFNVCPDWRRRRRVEGLFSSCQIVAVDYDNGDSIEEVIATASQIGIKFNILHHSFSSTPEHPKLRGIVFLEEEVTDIVKAKVFSTGLTYSLGGDTVCVDMARMYYGSRPDSIIHFDDKVVTPLSTLETIATNSEASKYVVTRVSVPKEYDSNWGTLVDQRKIWAKLTPGKREFVKRKILGILREIESFDGSDKTSRYECLWKRTSRIARMPETVGNVVKEWVLERVANNPYFSDWDKDPEAVVVNAIEWSFEHSEPPV